MIDNKQLFEKFNEEYLESSDVDHCLTEHIAIRFDQVLATQAAIKGNQTQFKRHHKDYEEGLRMLRRREAEIQRDCKHWSTTYHPDASGNNDFETICDICGAQL